MPLFLSDEEFERCSHDPSLLAEKADSFIQGLYSQIETVKAQSDAAAITAEQTCAVLEQKYILLSNDLEKLESQNALLNATIEQKVSELAQVQAEKHQLHLKDISKDGEIERLSIEESELHKSKRQLLELLEQKDLEISEKNATIKSYLDKIVNLTENAANREARLHDIESEMAHSRAACARLSQEKELLEKHNVWLNEELTAKVENLIELRRTHTELEAELSSKLADVEKQLNETSRSFKWKEEKVKELEMKLMSVQEELYSSKDTAAQNEDRFSAEISTTTKLVELYKESSEEWSRKAGELEGVIKALETHLSQVENDYKDKLEKEICARKEFEKEAADVKLKLEKCEAEIENSRKANELSLLPITYFTDERLTTGNEVDVINDDRMLVPRVPAGVSGTALAASLLRDGWSLAKMYEKYQETVDALRHERLGRKQSQAILERVLFEIEEKAEAILDERAEHEKMMEAYSLMNQKLQQSVSEQTALERTVQELKANLRKQERECDTAQKEILDLQKQVTVLLKECRDIQLRYGAIHEVDHGEKATIMDVGMSYEFDPEKAISEHLLTFKDINGLVEQNVKLRSLVRSLSDENEKRDAEIREQYELELQKQNDEAASKVAAVLSRAEEQASMIESLHSSVAMYKRLYEEELKLHASHSHSAEAVPVSDPGRRDIMLLLEGSQEASKRELEKSAERIKSLEERLDKARSDMISLRLERDKLAMESSFAREKLDAFLKEFEHQRDEMNGVLARNIEFSRLIVDYQRKLRESSDSLHAAEEVSRKLNIEVSILKHEKELLINSEKRASDEVRSLSERVHRLQASLDTIHSAEEVREEARAMERKNQGQYVKQVEREWAETKKELQEERDNARTLSLNREHTIKNAMRQVEEMGKELANALHALAVAEGKAAVAETRCSDLEAKLKSSQNKVSAVDVAYEPPSSLDREVTVDLTKANDEVEKLKEELKASKDHMLQYKNIAQVNEAALKQMESAHEKFKAEADKVKKSLEEEILFLKEKVSELENESLLKCKEVASVLAVKEEALDSALMEISGLKEENSVKMSQIMGMEIQISSLKEDLEKEHQRWRTAQNNYERQVILQSETIQELTKTSQALASLQEEASELRKMTDSLRSENDILKAKLESEKSALEQSRSEFENKYNEISEQNKILHNRLEALHIRLAEKERNSAGISSGISGPDSQGDGDLQTVVNYLRRSKEIAETEISLLKQEKLRLQSQLESALKASETTRALLHDERSKSRALLFSDEEFKSLQIQVREINLLRESNMQLREENKHNFEECQKLREMAQKTRNESEHLENMLRDKQIEADSIQSEIEMHKAEKVKLENRIAELVEASRNIDLTNYDQMKDNFTAMEAKLKEIEAEVEETKKIVSEKQDMIAHLEHDLANSHEELTEKTKRINESLQLEVTFKSDIEKQKRIVANTKRKLDVLSREKEELIKEKQALSKQLEESRQSKRMEVANEQAAKEKEKEKEKDTRIQILEKVLEREREDHQKEKAKRLKTEKTVIDLVKNVNQSKKELVDELERHKQAKDNLPESGGALAAQVPSATVLDNKAAAYLLAVEKFEEAAKLALGDGVGTRVPPSNTSPMDTSTPASAGQVASQVLTIHPSVGTTTAPTQFKTADETEKRPNLPRPVVEARKIGRKLVRPRLARPEEPSGDTEMAEGDTSSAPEGKRVAVNETESQVEPVLPNSNQPLARKRVAVSSTIEIRDESHSQLDASPDLGAPVSKKSRGTDSTRKVAEGQTTVPVENPEITTPLDESIDAGGDITNVTNEEIVDREKELDMVTEPADAELLKDQHSLEGLIQLESQELNVLEALEPRDMEEVFDELNNEEGQELQQPTGDIENEREEGELLPDVTEQPEAVDVPVRTPSPEPGQQELVTASDTPTTGINEESNTADMVETAILDVLVDEKNDASEITEDTPEDDKSNNNNEQAATERTQSPQASFGTAGGSPSGSAEPSVPNQGSSSHSVMPDTDESKDRTPAEGGRTIILSERAKERAILRQAGVVLPVTRGRGRAASTVLRGRGGRGARGGRGGRGQASDDKGQS